MTLTDPIRAAVMCRYALQDSGFDHPTSTHIYFLAEDIDLITMPDGTPFVTKCEAVEIIAVA